jgi:hypothetical protein
LILGGISHFRERADLRARPDPVALLFAVLRPPGIDFTNLRFGRKLFRKKIF